MIFAGETEVLGENLPSATLSTTNPTWIDPGLCGERPATNRLSHGTASLATDLLNSMNCYLLAISQSTLSGIFISNSYLQTLRKRDKSHKPYQVMFTYLLNNGDNEKLLVYKYSASS
jgi:hypothetical protein